MKIFKSRTSLCPTRKVITSRWMPKGILQNSAMISDLTTHNTWGIIPPFNRGHLCHPWGLNLSEFIVYHGGLIHSLFLPQILYTLFMLWMWPSNKPLFRVMTSIKQAPVTHIPTPTYTHMVCTCIFIDTWYFLYVFVHFQAVYWILMSFIVFRLTFLAILARKLLYQK